MHEYEYRVLDDLVVATKDGDWGSESPGAGLLRYHVIRGTDFPLARIGEVSTIPVRYLEERSASRRTLQEGDILIETAGGSKGRSTGRSLFISGDLLDRLGGLATCASFARFIRIDRNKADPRYIYWYLQYLYHCGGMWEHQVQHTGIARFQYTIFANSNKIPLPSNSEQSAISVVLDALDKKISVNDRIETTAEELLRANFEALQIDFDIDGLNSVPVSDLVEFNPRYSRMGPAVAVYVDMAAIPVNGARVREWIRREPKSGSRFMNGDTIMARITPCLENGKTAFIDFMEDGEVGAGSTEFIVMRSRPGIPLHLPYFLARSPRFRTHAVRNMVGSSGRQRVGVEQLAAFPLRCPDPRKLQAFGQMASRAFEHMKSVGTETAILASLRDTLLPKLMSGEIRVREAEEMVAEVT